MPENKENKVYTAGPWGGNKCCHCCDRCNTEDPEGYNNCTGCPPLCCTCPPLCDLEVVITATCCDGMDAVTFTMEKASWPQAPWNGTDLEQPVPRKRVRIPDHFCVKDNPTSLWQVDHLCYSIEDGQPCRYKGRLHPYEKWANITYCPEYDHGDPLKDDLYRWGEMFCPGSKPEPPNNMGDPAPRESDGEGCECSGPCPEGPDDHVMNCHDGPAPDPPCAGQWMTFSLCCCDSQDSAIVNADPYTGECKTCSYQFVTEWGPGYTHQPGITPDTCMPPRNLDVAVVGQVCSCYDGADFHVMGGAGAIPPDPGDGATWAGHGNGTTMIWEHVDGECGFSDEPGTPTERAANWRMMYRLGTCENPVNWNCDCCFNTEPNPAPPMPGFVMPKRQAYFTAIITAKLDTCQSDGGP